MIGKTLGNFEITIALGRGGMGEVYQAKDQKLGRDVAIKVLPEEFARDTDRVARFQREAKLLASLNHPNIAAIHGLEEFDGIQFLVLELVEGETLADQIKRGPIAVEESLKLALQIAKAIEAAHEKGVIHRDLKPANIKVTPDGKAKVLDFGLAKAFAGEQSEMNLSASPTLSHLATQQGIILGTAAYMSPEQAKGKTVDKRTDIWAFGCVLYEMLTGQAAFQGEDVTEILAAVVKGGANLDLLPADTHPRLREAIDRCLQKDLKNRYQDIGDLRFELIQILSGRHGAPPASPPIAVARKKSMLPCIAAVILALITGVAVWKFKPHDPHPVARFSQIFSDDQTVIPPTTAQVVAVSPDGSRFVCATNKGLYLRPIDQLEGRIIPGTETEGAVDPFFSPDGQWIGYLSQPPGPLKKIAIAGGTPVTICDVQQNSNASWCANNTIVFDSRQGIMRVSADGGTPAVILGRKEEEQLMAPQILPDGKAMLLTVHPTGRAQDIKVAVQSLGSEKRMVLFPGINPRYLPSGHLVYVQQGTLFAVQFDADKLEVKGGPVPLVQNIAIYGSAKYAVSDSGVLVYRFGYGAGTQSNRLLVWVDRTGKEEAIPAPPRVYAYARLSPDGTRVALDIRDQENDIWIWDLARKTLSRLTFDPGLNRGPIWTPDGKKVAFSAERDGSENAYWQVADGSGSQELLAKIPNKSILPQAFSPDGKLLLFDDNPSAIPRHNINVIGVGNNEPKRLLSGASNDSNPQISPNGRWIAYESLESGRGEVYVRPFPDVNAGRWQISTDGGTRPLWNANGRELFYYVPGGTMMAVPVETAQSFKAGSPQVIFKGAYAVGWAGRQYSVTPDGKRFLMIKEAALNSGSNPAKTQINVVVNWLNELKERVPTK